MKGAGPGRRWSALQYELAPLGPLGAPQSGRSGPIGRIRHKYWTRTTVRNGLLVSILLLMCLSCLSGTYVLWFTSSVQHCIQWVLTYREGGLYFNSWKNPTYTPITRVYIYNYTNHQEFLKGEHKRLKVEEIGPYSYSEALEKVNVKFHDDGTLSYSEKRVFTFLPDQSAGSEEDIVFVPSIALISAMSIVRDKGFAAQLGLRSALWALNIETGAFDRLRARDYLFGYSDGLYEAAQAALKLVGGQLPKLGILTSRNGVSDNVYTIHTGADNYSLVDVVAAINGKPDLGAWPEPACNRLDGAVGALFYPGPLAARERLYMYHVDLCRRIDLDFQKEVTVMGDLPALRYAPPESMFQNGRDRAENVCFASPAFGEWPSGVFLNAPCFSDSPVFVSYPRFYQADPKLREMVDGVGEPDMEKHQFSMDVHPDMGMAMGVASRFQINLMVRKASLVGDYLDTFEDNIILPSAWFEMIITSYGDTDYRRIWHATYTLRWAEAGLRYALPLLAALLAALAAHRMWRCFQCASSSPSTP